MEVKQSHEVDFCARISTNSLDFRSFVVKISANANLIFLTVSKR